VTDVQFPSPFQAGHQDKNVTVTGSVSTVDLDTTGQNATASSSVRTAAGAAGGIGGGLGAACLAGQGQNEKKARKKLAQRTRAKATPAEKAAKRKQKMSDGLKQLYRAPV
jgi:hypothetical protein